MKKSFLLVLFVLVFMKTQASVYVWNYQTSNNGTYFAMIMSSVEYLDGDINDKGTAMYMYVMDIGDGEVALYLHGEYATSDLGGRRDYIVVSFDMANKQRWRVKVEEANGYNVVRIVNSKRFIEYLKKAETIQIIIPIYKQGATTFYFDTNSYPLEW